jgi:hypothetical protein
MFRVGCLSSPASLTALPLLSYLGARDTAMFAVSFCFSRLRLVKEVGDDGAPSQARPGALAEHCFGAWGTAPGGRG